MCAMVWNRTEEHYIMKQVTYHSTGMSERDISSASTVKPLYS